MTKKGKIKKFKLGYKEYELLLVKDPMFDKAKVNGIINLEKNTITIRESLKGLDKTQVILHELVHAIDDLFDTKLNEDKTDKIAKGLAILFKENKELMKEILFEE